MNTEQNKSITANNKQKPNTLKVILNIISIYIVYNIVLNIIFILFEYFFSFLDKLPIIGLLVNWGNFTGILIATIIAICCVEFVGEKFLHNTKYEKFSKFIMGIMLIAMNCFNLLCVLCGSRYLPQYIILLISGIVYVVKNKDYKTCNDAYEDD